jgi:phosphoglycerol transferase
MIYFELDKPSSNFIADNYQAVSDKEVAAPVNKKNCIMIFVESLEKTFDGTETGFDIIPNLHELQKKNIHFENQLQISGTNFTSGALTAQLLGIPVILPFDAKSYSYFDKYFPNTNSVISVLEYNNYSINLIMGTSSNFGGIRNLYETHSRNPELYDSAAFLRDSEEQSNFNSNKWGFNDKFTLDKAKNIIKQLGEADKPFFAMVMTIDTHVPGVTYPENKSFYGDGRDAFLVSDQLISDFVYWIEDQPFYEDTVIIIIGDHCFNTSSIGDYQFPSELRRSIYNVFINTGIPTDNTNKSRLCSTMDIAPTILESLGFTLPNHKFGLGVSLLSDSPTLPEIYGFEYLNTELNKKSDLYNSFL